MYTRVQDWNVPRSLSSNWRWLLRKARIANSCMLIMLQLGGFKLKIHNIRASSCNPAHSLFCLRARVCVCVFVSLLVCFFIIYIRVFGCLFVCLMVCLLVCWFVCLFLGVCVVCLCMLVCLRARGGRAHARVCVCLCVCVCVEGRRGGLLPRNMYAQMTFQEAYSAHRRIKRTPCTSLEAPPERSVAAAVPAYRTEMNGSSPARNVGVVQG